MLHHEAVREQRLTDTTQHVKKQKTVVSRFESAQTPDDAKLPAQPDHEKNIFEVDKIHAARLAINKRVWYIGKWRGYDKIQDGLPTPFLFSGHFPFARYYSTSSKMVKFEPSVTLPNGEKMPLLGLGTWQSKPNEVKDAVEYALDLGYRHIDTAFVYGNEEEIGEALKKKIDEGVVKREDVFVTTKLWSTYHQPAKVLEAVNLSLKKLQLKYIDLYLIHNPAGFKFVDEKTLFPKDKDDKTMYDQVDHALIWKELEKAVDQGLVKAIGLSNFNHKQIQHVLDNSRIKPANLQVECHAYFMQKPLYEFCKKNNITFTAYGPLGSPTRWGINPKDPILLEEPQLKEIAKRHNKTPAQVLNRFLIERGRATIPKSVHRERIKENFDILDLKFTPEDLQQLDSLDKNLRYFLFDFIQDSVAYPFADPY
ncbi:Alcohol dehydrogenase [NADP(+)] [Hypsibius exemplaris]|uniref:Alcohol dehydrogenase [NADP(+)] n=1 Tax=Hypsibius exemplaris TaxID=2072580 RepID=A0A1W0X0R8_HYPEX|nr:Alcohol dehydrogenase [NADP(+)] [Hypsibius exemplaris]